MSSKKSAQDCSPQFKNTHNLLPVEPKFQGPKKCAKFIINHGFRHGGCLTVSKI